MVVELIVDPDNSGQSRTNPSLHVDMRHYTLAPVPEPGTHVLFILGLGSVGRAAWRRASAR